MVATQSGVEWRYILRNMRYAEDIKKIYNPSKYNPIAEKDLHVNALLF